MPADCRAQQYPKGYNAAVRRFFFPVLVNLLVPGAGLVLVGRTWMGTVLTAWFVLGAEVVLWGRLIAPATLPQELVLCGWGVAAATWLAAQVVLYRRTRILTADDLPRQLAILRRLADRAMARGDYRTAGAAINVGLSLDDGNLPIHIARARLAELTGHSRRARRAWRAVQRMDPSQVFARHTDKSLPVTRQN